jgi:hypothetical protein
MGNNGIGEIVDKVNSFNWTKSLPNGGVDTTNVFYLKGM